MTETLTTGGPRTHTRVRYARAPQPQRQALARLVRGGGPGSIVVLTVTGKATADPAEGRTICFGRNRAVVDLGFGEDDLRVSRRHGLLTFRNGRWWVRNTGRLPIEGPGSLLLCETDGPMPLAPGYTPLLVRGSNRRTHALEIHITGAEGDRPPPRPREATQPFARLRLGPDERLVLTVLGQRYLQHDPAPQPLSRQQAAAELADLRPDGRWTSKRVEHLIAAVRSRLSAAGVYGLTREEVGEPVGNALNVNLIRELLHSATLTPADLSLLDAPGPA